MKKKSIVIIFLLGAIVASAIKVADDIIERLGLQQKFVQENIVRNLVGRLSYEPMADYDNGDNQENFRLPYIPAPKLATILTGDKAAAARELCEYVKKYINSEEFVTEYLKQRESAMPLRDNGASLGTLNNNKIVHQKNISNYKTDTKYVAEQQKELDEVQRRIDALMEAAKKPFPGKANWEKKYPLDPSVVVKKRLQEYLQLAATVDFNAAITPPDKYRVKKFVNPVYEKKSNKWKAIYRAGKEVNDVVTAFVKDWLKGEIVAANKIKMTADIPATTPAATNSSSNNTKTAETVMTPNTSNKTQETPKTESNNTKPATEPAKQKNSLLKKVKGKIGM